MPEFRDATGNAWTIELDGLLLAEVRDKTGVDIVQDGLSAVEEREDVLTRVLLVVCREQITERKLTDRQFARLLAGSAAELSLVAFRGAAELFFRPSRWSEIQSRSEEKRNLDEQFRELKPMLDKLNSPDMPTAMRDAVMAAITSKLETAISSANSTAEPSASGLVASRLSAAGVSLDLSAYTPAV